MPYLNRLIPCCTSTAMSFAGSLSREQMGVLPLPETAVNSIPETDKRAQASNLFCRRCKFDTRSCRIAAVSSDLPDQVYQVHLHVILSQGCWPCSASTDWL